MHKNYVGMIEPIGPVVVSVCDVPTENLTYAIIRTKLGMLLLLLLLPVVRGCTAF